MPETPSVPRAAPSSQGRQPPLREPGPREGHPIQSPALKVCEAPTQPRPLPTPRAGLVRESRGLWKFYKPHRGGVTIGVHGPAPAPPWPVLQAPIGSARPLSPPLSGQLPREHQDPSLLHRHSLKQQLAWSLSPGWALRAQVLAHQCSWLTQPRPTAPVPSGLPAFLTRWLWGAGTRSPGIFREPAQSVVWSLPRPLCPEWTQDKQGLDARSPPSGLGISPTHTSGPWSRP